MQCHEPKGSQRIGRQAPVKRCLARLQGLKPAFQT
jgi:hypothetical protein